MTEYYKLVLNRKQVLYVEITCNNTARVLASSKHNASSFKLHFSIAMLSLLLFTFFFLFFFKVAFIFKLKVSPLHVNTLLKSCKSSHFELNWMLYSSAC